MYREAHRRRTLFSNRGHVMDPEPTGSKVHRAPQLHVSTKDYIEGPAVLVVRSFVLNSI